MSKRILLYIAVLLFAISAVSAPVPSYAQILTLEAWEMAGGSCPWVFPWNGSEYVKDNDIYSVARYPQGEYTDYYLLQQPLLPQGNNYTLEIREIDRENSWTDFTGLIAVDHASDVSVGTDDMGNISAFRPGELIAPVSAVSNLGGNVTALISVQDDSGFNAYSEDFIEVDFGNADVSQGARVVLRIKGFITGTGAEMPFIGPPAILVQTLNGSTWQEIGRLKPRFEWSEGVFDLFGFLPDTNGDTKVRLYSISHDIKYHEIDYVALSTGPEPDVDIKPLALTSADFNGQNVLGLLNTADDNYLAMTQGDKFSVSFATASQTLAERDFIFVSEGYYIPGNTYEVYTWDGLDWVMRDSSAFAATDETRIFDLSSFLPDPNGEYRVRILQTYTGYGNAGIDYVSLDFSSLIVATDLRDEAQWRLIYPAIIITPDILSLVISSDNVRLDYPLSGPRNEFTRWTEYRFDDGDIVDGATEDGAPNSGDGNNDGIPDRFQETVISLPSAVSGYVTVVINSPGCLFQSAQTLTEAGVGVDDPNNTFNFGLVGLTLSCSSAVVDVIYHGAVNLQGFRYRNYGPLTPGNPGSSEWYTFGNAVFQSGSNIVTLTLADGALGDDTGIDGQIVTLGGPVSSPLPTINEWGMIIFMVLAGLGAIYRLRRQRVKA